jgi:hypothetical protein
VRKIEAERSARQRRRGDRGFAVRAIFENDPGGGLVQGGTDQVAKETAGGNVMSTISLEMKSRGTGVFARIEGGIELVEFRRRKRLEMRGPDLNTVLRTVD